MEELVLDKVTGNYARIVEKDGNSVRLENPHVRLGWRNMAEVSFINPRQEESPLHAAHGNAGKDDEKPVRRKRTREVA